MEQLTPVLIAEIGAVHIGKIERAKELIRLAALCGAQYAKFQKRNPYKSTPKHLWDKPHPNQRFAYGKTYLEHRINLELSLEQHAELKAYCEQVGIGYSTSVWDLTSAQEIIKLNPDFIKVPSAQNNNWKLLEFLYSAYNGKIHISTGMINSEERQDLLSFIYNHGEHRTVVYHCTSAYPCPFENLYLDEIKILKNHYMNVGFSNHGYGIAGDLAALAFGARWFERHFIDDRTFAHNDAAASLEPEGLSKLCRDLKNVYKAFKRKPEALDALELEQRAKLRN